VFSEIRFALRQLIKTPGFTTIAVVTLALGIGLNTAMFSLLNTFLLRPPPFPEPDRLFQLNRTSAQREQGQHVPADYYRIMEASTETARVAAYRSWGFTLSEPGRPADMFTSHRVSPDYFAVLGVTPSLGRVFRPDEDAPGQNNVIVISDHFWRTRFESDPKILGRMVRLDGEPVEIVGVLAASMSDTTLFGPVRIFRPMGFTTEERASRTDDSLRVLARLRPGVDPAQAQAQFETIAARIAADRPQERADFGVRLVSLQSTGLGRSGRNLTYVLLGLSASVLLIACGNLANLLLARAIARAREFAIRAALGASRSQLIRPLVAECVLLAVAGGGLGILVSQWTTEFMARRLGGEDSTLYFATDLRVLAFAFLVALVTGVLFGVTPALLVSRVRVNDMLKSGSRGSTGDRSHRRYRQALIVGQMALALVLLAGASVFFRGINRLLSSDAGWDAAVLVSGKIAIPADLARDPERSFGFYRQVQERLLVLPGVTNASVDLDLPIYGFPGPRSYLIDGTQPPAPGQEPKAYTNAVMPEYFATVGTRILAGRAIEATDTLTSPPVMVINQAMAEALFPDGNAIGNRLALVGDKAPRGAEIVAIAADVSFKLMSGTTTPFQVYKPLSQETWGYVSVTVRAHDAAATSGLVEPFRKIISELNSDLPVMNLSPVPLGIERSMSDLAMIRELLVGFASLGLFLAALGVYGVIARMVLERTNEIGIRMALGAQMRDVVRLVMQGGLGLVALGTVLGLGGAFVLARILASAMPGIAAESFGSVFIATVILATVALLASLLPARRATKVNSLDALRSE